VAVAAGVVRTFRGSRRRRSQILADDVLDASSKSHQSDAKVRGWCFANRIYVGYACESLRDEILEDRSTSPQYRRVTLLTNVQVASPGRVRVLMIDQRDTR